MKYGICNRGAMDILEQMEFTQLQDDKAHGWWLGEMHVHLLPLDPHQLLIEDPRV